MRTGAFCSLIPHIYYGVLQIRVELSKNQIIMKKLYNTFSKILCALLLCAGFVFTGCYDDSALQAQLNDHELRLKELERLCSQANTNIEALQTIVSALQENDYVTNVAPIKEGDKVLGYTITFSKSGAVTIYHGRDGQNGSNGTNGDNGIDGIDGHTPVISVKRDADDIWYWVIDGEWLLDSDGNKVKAVGLDGQNGSNGSNGINGVTPKLKIENGQWYVSYDGGETFDSEPLGQATGDKGDSMFEEVTYDEDYLYITMSDGQQLALPRTSVSSGEGIVGPATFSLGEVTATTAEFKGHIDLPKEELAFCNVTLYYSQDESFHLDDAIAYSHHEFDENNVFEFGLGYLTFNTEYHYCLCVEYRGRKYFSENIMSFKTSDISIEVVVDESSITYSSALLSGKVTGMSEEDVRTSEIEILYSSDYTKISEDMWRCESVQVNALEDGGLFRCQLSTAHNGKYYYRYRLTKWTPFSHGDAGGNNVYGDIKEFIVPKNPNSSANCYIVANGGEYKFVTVKGNSSESVGAVASAKVLWESFGTDVTPSVGDLIKSVSYADGVISFQTADTFKEGNAVIAAKDASGNILWSWHIWLTDQPERQVYYNNAGTMMDRNLGATSATPGDVGTLGLLYQWGRKDPFLGYSSISSSTPAESTITWPAPIESTSSTGTIAYATVNPTTFITYNNSNYDWYYTGSSSTDNTRWTTSEANKSIYDPCPAGWRVPDGGDNGVWSKAIGSSSYFSYDITYIGTNFSGKFGSDQTIWYPASDCWYGNEGYPGGVDHEDFERYEDYEGFYWSASHSSNNAYSLHFSYGFETVYPSDYGTRAYGFSVRCIQE